MKLRICIFGCYKNEKPILKGPSVTDVLLLTAADAVAQPAVDAAGQRLVEPPHGQGAQL